MSTLNVYLGNHSKMDLNWYNIEDATWYFFNKSIKRNKKFDKVRVKTVTTQPALLPTDLLIYICRSDSVLGQKFGYKPIGEYQQGRAEWAGSLYGAEVYIRGLIDPWQIAKFVWHEAFHVKRREENGMHKRGGLASSPIKEHTWITEKNEKEMAAVLDKHREFWTGPFHHTKLELD